MLLYIFGYNYIDHVTKYSDVRFACIIQFCYYNY